MKLDPKLILGSELVKLIAEIDEFKGRWEALKALSPEGLSALGRVAQESDDELSELSLQVLKALRAQERLTIAQLTSITNANRNTLKVRLRELVSAGRLRQHGKARATWYSL